MKLLDYAGPCSSTTLAKAAKLSSLRWAAQPKMDGAYCRVTTDRHGRIVTMLTRSGAPFARADAGDHLGVATGLPDAVLAAELECHTEAGVRARETRGFPLLHLFDISMHRGRSVAQLGYGERYALLNRGIVKAEMAGRVQSYSLDDQGDAHDGAGRYCRAVPRDVRLLPIVPMYRGSGFVSRAWDDVVGAGGEGLVLVALDATLGKRGSKLKLKPVDTLDCRVLSVSRTAVLVSWHNVSFAVGTTTQPAVGAIVEVAHNGWFETAVCPRFPRLVRVRADL